MSLFAPYLFVIFLFLSVNINQKMIYVSAQALLQQIWETESRSAAWLNFKFAYSKFIVSPFWSVLAQII